MSEAARVVDGSAAGRPARARLLVTLDRLCAGMPSAPARLCSPALAPEPTSPVFSAEDEQLVVRLRAGLARLGARTGTPTRRNESLRRALDAAEYVTRGEILMGREERLPQLLPGFAFLAVLPTSGRAEALHASRQASRLLEGGGGPR